ncbi:unnamed protein product [Bursaphelenchus xylophilus]|uniref:(pine wood nematode) hypothetical protein n=1 Tax=Bursaphelenchus xylophilus TaxID=6326 RepID=A0A1I7S8G5_BURXY|nr:unnamed protein product [Bursaphelenchus xylophilus]CAG9121065.1 unnamed protein product [Bursaphelenchus xylophilus]
MAWPKVWVLSVLLIPSIISHSNPSFPGQDAHKPPEVHHQPPPPPPPQGQAPSQAAFGGEQAKDEGHIKEHLEGKVDPTANMTPEQLQFHYFNMHDLDKNGRLDGVELIKAITHFHQENPTNQHDQHAPPPLPSEEELEQMIDAILKEDDFNNDGYIDYGEFLRAQKQREEQAKQHAQQQPPPPPPPRQ